MRWKSSSFTCSVPLPHSLYLLPVKFRIEYKILHAKLIMKNDLLFTPCLRHHSHPVHWDQTKESLCRFCRSRPTQIQWHFAVAPFPLENLPLCVCSATSIATFKRHLKNTTLLIWLSPIDTSMPDAPLFIWRCFMDVLLNINSAVAPLSLTSSALFAP